MDSDQSEELFSDDDNEENVEDSSSKYPEVDSSMIVNCYPQFFDINYSPCYKNPSNTAEIPTTPLSLAPHISKAQLWTSDLETPDTKKYEKQFENSTDKYQGHYNYHTNNQSNAGLSKTPVGIDSPGSDEIIPGSQESYRKKRRKLRGRPNRRILSNISNNSYSNGDTYDSRTSLEYSNDEDCDGKNDSLSSGKLSPIVEHLNDEKLDEIDKPHSKENNERDNEELSKITPGERLRQLRSLRELSQSQLHCGNVNIIDMTESDFVRSFRDLENSRLVSISRDKNIIDNQCAENELNSLRQIIKNEIDAEYADSSDQYDNNDHQHKQHLQDHHGDREFDNDNEKSYLDTTIGKMDTISLIDHHWESQLDDDFTGFTSYCLQYSKLACDKYSTFSSNKLPEYLSENSRKILEGFSNDEIDKSSNLAAVYRLYYENYLTEQLPIGNKTLRDEIFREELSVTNIFQPIKLSLKSWWNTASDKELLVSVRAVTQSESWLLRDDFCKHSIDELLPSHSNRIESEITESNSIKSESQVSTFNNECNSFVNNKIVFQVSSSTTIIASQALDTDGELTCTQTSMTKVKLLNEDDKFVDNTETDKEDLIRKNGKISKENIECYKQDLKSTNLASSTSRYNDNFSQIEDTKLAMIENIPITIGFQTGQGQHSKVSETTLLKEKNIFTDDDLDLEMPTLCLPVKRKSTSDTECAKSNIQLPKNILSAKHMFNNRHRDDSDDGILAKSQKNKKQLLDTDVDTNQPGPSNILQFSTVHNVKECLLKKNIFHDEDVNDVLDMPTIPIAGFRCGIEGKPFKIPEKALLKAKNIFTDEDLRLDDVPINPVPLKTGSQTSKNINVKEYTKVPDSILSNTKNTPVHNNNEELVRKNIRKSLHPELNKRKYSQKYGNNTFIGNRINKLIINTSNDAALKVQNTEENYNNKESVSITPLTVLNGQFTKVPENTLPKAKNIFTEDDLHVDDLTFNFPEKKGFIAQKKNINAYKVSNTTGLAMKNVIDKAYTTPSNIPRHAGRSSMIGFHADGTSGKILEDATEKRLQQSCDLETDRSAELVSGAQKRKYHGDKETPAGRKRSRVDLDLQKRKLFDDIEEEDATLMQAVSEEYTMIHYDRDFGQTRLETAKMVAVDTEITGSSTTIASIINDDEVRDSVAAFLKEETNFNEIGNKWIDNDDNCNRKLSRSRTTEGSSLCTANTTVTKPQCDNITESKCPRYYPSYSEPINQCTTATTAKISNLKSPVESPKYDSIPEELFFDTEFSQENSAMSIKQIREARLATVLEQQKIISSKKRSKVQPSIGSLLSMKQNSTQISLKNYFVSPPEMPTPDQVLQERVDIIVMSINSSTAAEYQFNLCMFYGPTFIKSHVVGIPIGDGATLIPNESNCAGVQEFKTAFLASPGVDPNLMPNGWVENHYKWIVWKLASMEKIKVSRGWTDKFLTPDQVMKQLKYRYDREIDRVQRSALRRILEKDDPPSRRLVLCVSKICENSNLESSKCRTIELTDNWYSILAVTDYAMQPYINSKKIVEGTKLMIFGAELINHDEGRYPLDITSNVRLKIHTNSTRRARWDAKLGYQRNYGPMKISLKSVKSNGGLIGELTVAIARIYPLVYRELTSDGQSIVRNSRCEEKAVIAYEKECQSRFESIYFKAQKSGESNAELEDQMKSNLPVRRNVTSILKIKVTDGDVSAICSVWSCDEDTEHIFKEGTCITIYNASAGKRMNELQILAGRSTVFEPASSDTITCPPRIFTSLEDVCLSGFNPDYGEFDTIGVVVSIGPAPHGMKNFETVNIAYKHDNYNTSPSYYLSILFWKGVASYGFAEIANVGSFIACSNLEWRRNTYRSIPTAFCTEQTVLTRNPRQSHLRHDFEAFYARIKNVTEYVELCATIIQEQIVQKSGKLTPGSASKNSSINYRQTSNMWTPEQQDRESLVHIDSARSSDSKKMNVINRLEKLKHFGEAPELSPIHLATTPRLSLDFRSPVTPVSKSSIT